MPAKTPTERGEHLMMLSEHITSELNGLGRWLDRHDTMRIFHILADDLYGNLPINTPPERKPIR